PGTGAPQLFGAILAQFAELTGQDLEAVVADFEDPAAKLAQLSHLEDAALHRRLGDRLAPLLAEIEQGPIHDFYSEVVPALRAADPTGLILREHDYFGNIGIPAPLPPLADTAWAYSPLGYELLERTWNTTLIS